MQWMAVAGDYQLTGEFESDLNRIILLENMEEEERMGKEFEQILEDENIKSKREQDIRRAMFYFPFMDREDAEEVRSFLTNKGFPSAWIVRTKIDVSDELN